MPPLIWLANAIRASATARWSTVLKLQADTRMALSEQRTGRREVARRLRAALRQHRLKTRAAVRAARMAATSDRHAARAEGTDSRVEPSDELLETQIVNVIASHPEGVRAVDVGNALGVDWRRVIAVTRGLVGAGAVEEIEQEFYPAAEASDRW